jgi:hypothetical protein
LDLKPVESSSNSRDIIEPIKLEKIDQKTNAYHEYRYGTVPLGLEERKGEFSIDVFLPRLATGLLE